MKKFVLGLQSGKIEPVLEVVSSQKQNHCVPENSKLGDTLLMDYRELTGLSFIPQQLNPDQMHIIRIMEYPD